ncbi:MAG: MinD/ParA family protein [Nonomuraea sp.]|nr:MinD/ParA family protein [Nonomuraea sp.]
MHGEPEEFESTVEAGAFDSSKTTQWVRRDAPHEVLDPDQERARRFPPPNQALPADRLGHFAMNDQPNDQPTVRVPETRKPPAVNGLPYGVPVETPDPPAWQAQDTTTSESLRPDRLLRNRRRPPAGGWRRLVYTLSGGLVHPGPSRLERHRMDLVERIRRPVAKGHFRVAVMSLKGGVGKTTTTIALGSTLAAQRGDRVIAVDANPDRGTLSDKLRLESTATIRDLLNDRAGLRRYADVRSYTSQAPSRLEVLASDRDPAISEAFNADDYRHVAEILDQFYSIAITDCGTGMLHSAMSAILAMADQIVLVSPVTVDGARSASATLDWLQAHGHRPLAGDAVVVLSAVKNVRRNAVDIEELKGHFAKRCRAVIGVPFDPHLEEGYEVDLDLLQTSTRDTYLELGATIADAFDRRDPP